MSSNLVLSGRPNEQSQIESLQRELYTRNNQLNDAEQKIVELENELRAERLKTKQIERGAHQVREVLTPLHNALRLLFGEFDAMDIDEPQPASASSATRPVNSAVWEDWKKKLGGAAAKIIDILHLHGQLDQTQIRIHLGTNRMQTVYDAVSKLNKAGIINKRDGRISLKEL